MGEELGSAGAKIASTVVARLMVWVWGAAAERLGPDDLFLAAERTADELPELADLRNTIVGWANSEGFSDLLAAWRHRGCPPSDYPLFLESFLSRGVFYTGENTEQDAAIVINAFILNLAEILRASESGVEILSSQLEQVRLELVAQIETVRSSAERTSDEVVEASDELQIGPVSEGLAEGFTGREWLAAAIDGWLESSSARQGLLLIGEPGIGKSAFAAWFAADKSARVCAAHFCTRRYMRTLDPHDFVSHLVEQLRGGLVGYSDAIAGPSSAVSRERASDAFYELVVQGCRRTASPDQPLVLVVDSLDEADTRDGETILDVLTDHCDHLPGWLRIVATTQPIPRVMERMGFMDSLHIEPDSEENLSDLAEFVDGRLRAMGLRNRQGAPDVADAWETVLSAANGSFLYAHMVLKELESGDLTPDGVTSLPRGISAYLTAALSRAFPSVQEFLEDCAPMLSCIIAAHAPVPFSVLAHATGASATVTHHRLRRLRPYLRRYLHDGAPAFAPYHHSLTTWLSEMEQAGDYWCDPEEGHRRLAEALSELPTEDEYKVGGLPGHLVFLRRWADLAALLGNPTFLRVLRRADRYEPQRLWAMVEGESGLTCLGAYQPVLADPSQYKAYEVQVVARTLRAMGHSLEAEVLFGHVVDRRREEGEPKKLVEALNLHGLVLRSIGQLEDAMRLHAEQEGIARVLGREKSLQTALNNQALVLISKGDLQRAWTVLEEAERICRDGGFRQRLESVVFNQARVLRKWGNTRGALEKFDEAVELSEEVANPNRLQNALRQKANMKRVLGELSEAETLLDRTEEIAAEIALRKSMASTLAARGKLAHAFGDIDSAKALLEEAERSARQHGTSMSLYSILTRLSRVLLECGDQARVLELLTEAESILRDSARLPALAPTLSLKSRSLAMLGDTRAAQVTLAEADSIAAELEQPHAKLEVSIAHGEVLLAQGDTAGAIEALEVAAELARNVEDVVALGRVLMALAVAHELDGGTATALERLDESIDLAEKMGAQFAAESRRQLRHRIASYAT